MFVGSSSMYVKSESGRGPVWLRELRILCKLCKLWTERRSSRSSRVDLNALITRSCKNREGRLSGSEEASQQHTSTPYIGFCFFFFARTEVCFNIGTCPPFLYFQCPQSVDGSGLVVVLVAVVFLWIHRFFISLTANISFLFIFTSVT